MAAENEQNMFLREAMSAEAAIERKKEAKKLVNWKRRRTVYSKTTKVVSLSGRVLEALAAITAVVEVIGGDIKTPLLSSRGLWYVVGDAWSQFTNVIGQLLHGNAELFQANLANSFSNLRYEQLAVNATLAAVGLGVLLHKLAKKRKTWKKISQGSVEEARLYKENTAKNFENGKLLGKTEGMAIGEREGYNKGVVSEQARIVQSYTAQQPYTFMANGQPQQVAVTPYMENPNLYGQGYPHAQAPEPDRGRQMGGSDL